MTKRALLRVTVGGIGLVGIGLAAYPFVMSMNVNPAQENAAWGECDVSGLPAGAMQSCGWAAVYRRTERDKAYVDTYAHLLADPESTNSEQPESARNKWRSENPDFFIFRPWAPVKGCSVKLFSSGEPFWWEPPEQEAIRSLPYYAEPCEGRTWDMSGRLYWRDGYPPEENLIVPEVQWRSESRVLIHGK